MKIKKKTEIKLTLAEIQCGSNRVHWAEGLIKQLPRTHEGRNSWLLNYGVTEEADLIRSHSQHQDIEWSEDTDSVKGRGEQE